MRYFYDMSLDNGCLVHDLTLLRATMGILESVDSLDMDLGLVDLK